MNAQTQRTPGELARNIVPARKYPTLFAGRNTHVLVLDTRGKEDAEIEANADYLVEAWNNYESLRASRDALAAALRGLEEAYCEVGPDMSNSDRARHRKVLMEARAALAQLKP